MTKYGYARVSTASQSTKEQIQQLLENGVEKKNIFSEKFTGTKRDRPKFNQLLAGLKPGDEIVVTKLDRFARFCCKVLNNLICQIKLDKISSFM